jgi:hypothetical protein
MTTDEKAAWEGLRKETEETRRLAEKIQRLVEQDERTVKGEWSLSVPPPPSVPPGKPSVPSPA